MQTLDSQYVRNWVNWISSINTEPFYAHCWLTDVSSHSSSFSTNNDRSHGDLQLSGSALMHILSSKLSWFIIPSFWISARAWLHILSFSIDNNPFRGHPLTLRTFVIAYPEFLDHDWPIYGYFKASKSVWLHILVSWLTLSYFMATFALQRVRHFIFLLSRPTLTCAFSVTLGPQIVRYSLF